MILSKCALMNFISIIYSKAKLGLSISMLIMVFCCHNVFGQEIEWQHSYGGSGSDICRYIQQTTDGGYIGIGWSFSNDGDVEDNNGSEDVWVMKLSEMGEIIWEQNYGGTGSDYGTMCLEISDDGYIVVGRTGSVNGDVSGNNGLNDIWVLKLSDAGEIQWEQNYGGSDFENVVSIVQTEDGGYILLGDSKSSNGDVSSNEGSVDAWILKLSNMGEIEWEQNYGGSDIDDGRSLIQTLDGGFIFVGRSRSTDGDVGGNNGEYDLWVVKLSEVGEIEWEENYGGSESEIGYSIVQTSDEGYIVSGSSSSSDGDVGANYGSSDLWVLKLSQVGEIEWEQNYGGTEQEFGWVGKIIQTMDGGYLAAINSSSSDGDVAENNGLYDIWLVKLSPTGEIEWEENYGSSSQDYVYSIQQTNNGNYIIGGMNSMEDGDVTGNNGGLDAWIIKIDKMGTLTSFFNTDPVNVFPNPTSNYINLEIPTELKYRVNLYDSKGKIIITNLQTNQINISAFIPGIYWVEVIDVDTGYLLSKKKLIKH